MPLFTTAVKYGKTAEDGTLKSTTEYYLVEADSHAEAETRITVEIATLVQTELEVTKVQKVNFAEVIITSDADADEYWKVNYFFIIIDEKTGKEKRTPAKTLIQCSDYRDCIRRFDNAMKDSMIDFEVTAVSKTKYLDIIKEE